MSKGLADMEQLMTKAHEHRTGKKWKQTDAFDQVFAPATYKHATFGKKKSLWKNAPTDLREKYISAGKTKAGLLSRFYQEAAGQPLSSCSEDESEQSDSPGAQEMK